MEVEEVSKPLKIDKAIATAKYILKKKKVRIDQLSKNIHLNESQKIFIGQETELLQIMELLINESKAYINAHLGKLPPQATDLEESLLGAIILEQPALPRVCRFLKAEHFREDKHQEIYSAIIDLNNANESVDMRSVVFKLRQRHTLEQIGGAYYIAELTSKVSSSAMVERDARILIELAIKRELIKTCSEVSYDCYDEATDCFEVLERAEQSFKHIHSWLI